MYLFNEEFRIEIIKTQKQIYNVVLNSRVILVYFNEHKLKWLKLYMMHTSIHAKSYIRVFAFWVERVFAKFINSMNHIKRGGNPLVSNEVFAVVKISKEDMVSIWE